MSTIKVICVDQVLAFEETPIIASGGLNENFVEFSFCSQWDGFAKTAVFWRSEEEVLHVVLDGKNTCQIPPELTTEEGRITFGVFGVDPSHRQRTSNLLTYHIEKGAITVGTTPPSPTPDIYTQILAGYANLVVPVQEIKNGIIVLANQSVTFTEGKAVFKHASIIPSSICIVQRRAATAGLTGEFSFATTAGMEEVTIVMEAAVDTALQLNIIVFNI